MRIALAVAVIVAIAAWVAALFLLKPNCGPLELDANNRQAAIAVCANTPGCDFSAADIIAALTVRDEVAICKAKE